MKASLSRKLTALLLSCAVWFGMSAMTGTMTAYAADGNAMKAGDHVKMGVASEEYDGIPEWIVLDTVDTNNDGSPDQAYLMSAYLWRDKGNSTLQFNDSANNNWDESKAKEWCGTFYQKVLKNSDLVADTDISDPAGDNMNALESKGNKVFLPSLAEMKDTKYFKDNAARVATLPPGTTSSSYSDKGAYWTRTPMQIGNRVGSVTKTGYPGNNSPLASTTYMRPVFYLDLNSDACVQRTESGDEGAKTVTWTYDVENPGHTYDQPVYIWSEDHSTCTATATCAKCGKALKEEATVTSKVTKEASVEEEGNTQYTAEFKNGAFNTQTKNVPIEKLPKPNTKPSGETLKTGRKYSVNGASYQVISAKKCTAALVKAKNTKAVSVPATIKISGKNCKVVQLNRKAFTERKSVPSPLEKMLPN